MDCKGVICVKCTLDLGNAWLMMKGEVISLHHYGRNEHPIKTLYTCDICGNMVILDGWDTSGYTDDIEKAIDIKGVKRFIENRSKVEQ